MNVRKNDAPCKDCTNRSIGCHARCENYSLWRKGKDKEILDRAKERELKVDYEDARRRYKGVSGALKHKSYK